jgi:hypothetical protein
MILSTRTAVFIGDLRSRVSWASIVDPRRVLTTTPADRAIGRRCRRWFCRCFSLQAMKLPRTRNRWTERLLIDDAFDAYLDWRDESAEVWHAYKRWKRAPAREARGTFWAYRAALEREEHAARVYGRLASRLEARARERAETPRRSHLRPLLS